MPRDLTKKMQSAAGDDDDFAVPVDEDMEGPMKDFFKEIEELRTGCDKIDAKIKDVKNRGKMVRFEFSQVNEWTWVFGLLEYFLKEWTRSCQNNFMCFEMLTIPTRQSYISKIIVASQFTKSSIDIIFEVTPL